MTKVPDDLGDIGMNLMSDRRSVLVHSGAMVVDSRYLFPLPSRAQLVSLGTEQNIIGFSQRGMVRGTVCNPRGNGTVNVVAAFSFVRKTRRNANAAASPSRAD